MADVPMDDEAQTALRALVGAHGWDEVVNHLYVGLWWLRTCPRCHGNGVVLLSGITMERPCPECSEASGVLR